VKRIITGGLGAAVLLGVMGCGGAGVDEGLPKGDMTPTVKMDPSMTDPSGRFGVGAAKTAVKKNEEAAKAAPTPDPADEKK